VVAGVIGALTWMLEHPREGVVEAENLDGAQVLATARPYLGKLTTVETDWRPASSLEFDEFLLGAETRP
jgi:homospermidine synthase